MIEPQRLVDSGDPLGRALLGAAAQDAPDPARRARALAALGLGAATVTGAATAQAAAGATAKAASATAAAGGGGLVGAKGLALVAALLGLAGGVVVVTRQGRAPAASPTSPPRVGSRSASEPPAPPRSSELPPVLAVAPPSPSAVVAPQPKAPRRQPRPAAVTLAPVPGASLAAEVAALDQARAALARRDPVLALEALELYALDFPAGRLAPEALAIEVEAHLAADDRVAAEQAAARLFHDHGGSAIARRVRTLLGD